MDLIYTDENGVDVGVIAFYDFDLAFGRDENDFQLTLPLVDHCCEIGNMIYIDDTEYGGIIDAIKVDIKNGSVIYSGRTWHGIINSKVVDYDLEINGNVSDAIKEIITKSDLSDLFHVNNSDATLFGFTALKYSNCYDVISSIMTESRSKLKIRYNGRHNRVDLTVESRIDYVNDDYFDSDTIEFTAQRSNDAINHVICILSNDTEEKRIDVFSDENGTIQPYIKNELALIDESRYYLDKSQQAVFGKEEIVEIQESGIDTRYIYHSLGSYPTDWISNFENYWHSVVDDDGNVSYEQNVYDEKPYYIKVASEPDDWENNWRDYFTYKEVDNDYISAAATNENVYELLSSKPTQWDDEYSNYYYKEDGEYKNVEGGDEYVQLNSKPQDWSSKYMNYFEKVGTQYIAVQSTESNPKYIPMTERPQDWESSPSSYWYKATKYKQINANGQITAVEDGSAWLNIDKYYAKDGSGIKTYGTIPNFVLNKYYTREMIPVAPMFIVGRYFSQNEDAIAPEWQSGTYYFQTTTEVPPTFVSNKFYVQRTNKYVKRWVAGKYFYRQEDNYIVAIENAIAKINESFANADSLDIELPTIYNYDIGDVVGATEHITQLEVAQLVTKKIVKIQNGIVSVNYEIGKEK